MTEKIFDISLPVWAEGLEDVINVTCGIYTGIDVIPGRNYRVFVTASSFYRLFVNGEFVNHGSARCGHGYYRVDEIDITDRLQPGRKDRHSLGKHHRFRKLQPRLCRLCSLSYR